MIKLLDILSEMIRASEAYTDKGAMQTIIDRKRNVGWLVRGATDPKDWEELQGMIQQNGLKTMHVEGNEYDAYIVYRPGHEKQAHELKDIAEKYGGFLAWNATEEDSRKIGELLEYDPEDIEDYIKQNKTIQELKVNNPNDKLERLVWDFYKELYKNKPGWFEYCLEHWNIKSNKDGSVTLYDRDNRRIIDIEKLATVFNVKEKVPDDERYPSAEYIINYK
jgi:hypothetical protein